MYAGYFDFIYISEGSLQWFPDLNKFFAVVSRLLKQDGNILIFGMHPFAYFFETGFSPEKLNFKDVISCFEKGPYHYKEGLDYVGGVSYESKECYWFMHRLSDVLMSILHSAIEMLEFDKYNSEMENNPETSTLEKFPPSYILTGKRNRKRKENLHEETAGLYPVFFQRLSSVG